MSIASAIQNARTKIAAAYTACNNKGATMPSSGSQNLANLASTINTITGGGGGGLPGFEMGAFGVVDDSFSAPNGIMHTSLSPLIDMTGRGGHSIRIYPGAGFAPGVALYPLSVGYENLDGTGNMVGYDLQSTYQSSITFDSSCNSLRSIVYTDFVDNAFVYDETTKEYLFKGIQFVTKPILPTGYTAYDYLQCDSTAYIDSGIKMAVPISMEIKFMHNSTVGDYIFIGGRNDSGASRFFLLAMTGNMNYGYGNYYNGGSASQACINGWPLIARTSFAAGSQVFNILGYWGSNKYSQTQSSALSYNKNIYIFKSNYSPDYHVPSGDRIYWLKFYDDANYGNLIFHGVPCKNSSNAAGLYDLVSGSFFGNDGGGSFTVGND